MKKNKTRLGALLLFFLIQYLFIYLFNISDFML